MEKKEFDYFLLKIKNLIARPIQSYKRDLRYIRIQEMFRGKSVMEKIEGAIKVLTAG